MSWSTATKNAALAALLKGTDRPYRANATQYVALFSADPGNGGSISNELSYTGYSRVALTKSSAWTDNGDSFANAALVQFGKRTDVGSVVATHFAIVDTASSTIAECLSGELTDPLTITQNIQPQFAAGQLTITAVNPA